MALRCENVSSSHLSLSYSYSPSLFYPIIPTYKKRKKKVATYKAFIANPKMDTELELLRLSSDSEKESIKEIANALYQRQAEIGKLNSLLAEYEDYVEKWAHEIKLPLSLLSLLLDNQSDQLPKNTAFKLDYVKIKSKEMYHRYYSITGLKVKKMIFYLKMSTSKSVFRIFWKTLIPCLKKRILRFS